MPKNNNTTAPGGVYMAFQAPGSIAAGPGGNPVIEELDPASELEAIEQAGLAAGAAQQAAQPAQPQPQAQAPAQAAQPQAPGPARGIRGAVSKLVPDEGTAPKLPKRGKPPAWAGKGIKTHSPEIAMLGAGAGLLGTARLWLFGADSSLIGMEKWGIPAGAYSRYSLGDFHFDINYWLLICLGITAFQVAFCPISGFNPLKWLSQIAQSFRDDPVLTVVWFIVLGLDSNWTYLGLKGWFIQRELGLFNLSLVVTENTAWAGALIASIATALAPEPLSRRFWAALISASRSI